MTTRSPAESKPSISTSSWLSVCSRSELLSEPRRAADGVELVDEDDRRAVLARLGEQAPDARGAEAGEHLDERGGRLGEELRAGLVRDRLGQQRLAGAGRAVEQDPLRHLRAERGEPLGVAQELDHLAQLRLRLVAAGDVVPGDRGRGLRLDLLRLRPRHQLQRPPDEEHQQAHEDDRGPGDDPVLHLVPGERNVRHCDQYARRSAVRARVQTPYVRPGRAHRVAAPGAPARRPARHRGARLRPRSIPAARAAIRALEPEIDVREVRGAGLPPPRSAPPTRRVRQQQRRAAGRPRRAAPVRPPRRRAGGLPLGERDVRRLAGLGGAAGRALRPPRRAGAVERVRVRPHPATRGVPARFSLPEEFYVHQPGVGRRTRVLARWGAARRPLVWVRTPGRGRVFYDALGHFTATWSDPRQRALVRSGLRWVLRLDGSR